MAADLLDKWRAEIASDLSHTFDTHTARHLRLWRLLPFGSKTYLAHRAKVREEYIAKETERRLAKKMRRL